MAHLPVVEDRGPALEAALYLTDGTRLVLGLHWEDLHNGGVLVEPRRVASAERGGVALDPAEALGVPAGQLGPDDRVWVPGARIAALVLRSPGARRRPVGFGAG